MALQIVTESPKQTETTLLIRKCQLCMCVSRFIEIEFNGATRLYWNTPKSFSNCPSVLKSGSHRWGKTQKR